MGQNIYLVFTYTVCSIVRNTVTEFTKIENPTTEQRNLSKNESHILPIAAALGFLLTEREFSHIFLEEESMTSNKESVALMHVSWCGGAKTTD